LEKIKDDLIEQQEYKNALASKIRSFTTVSNHLETFFDFLEIKSSGRISHTKFSGN